MRIEEVIKSYGHKNIQATHKSTFEVTKDKHLSRRGDCVIAIAANKGSRDLNDDLKTALQKGGKLRIVVEVDDETDVIVAWGSPKLILSHPTDMVVRKGSYVCPRTIAIDASKAARDLSRNLVAKLRNPQEVTIRLAVEHSRKAQQMH